MDKRLLEARRLLKEQFPTYAKAALQIRTKDGEIAPFWPLKPAQQIVLDEIQRQERERGYSRVVILKARQLGMSTFVGGYFYFRVSQTKGAKALVLAHTSDAADGLFGQTRRYHDNVPDFLRPDTRYSSKKEIVFSKLDSAYLVATAGGQGVGRGHTFTHVHASELAFWKRSTAKEIWNGIRQSVPDKPGTSIIIESTPNGVGDLFYDLCMSSGKREISPGVYVGDTDYSLVYLPWFMEEEYRAAPPEYFERTPDEEVLADRYGLDDAQLFWRRLKVSEVGHDQFTQEYSSNIEEAFLSSGRPVFDQMQLAAMLKQAQKLSPRRMALTPLGDWEDDPRGELWVYREPEPSEMYVIGADVSKGVKHGDWSVAVVMDSKRRICAVWRGQVVSDYFAKVLEKMGYRYNVALLIPEANDHGVLTCYVLQKNLNYPAIFKTVRYDETTDRETVVVGFSTTSKSKPVVIDQLRASIRDGLLTVPDVQTLQEMQVYIVTEAGKMEADAGFHDDCVMALAIANHGCMTLADPIEPTDDYYCEAL